MDTIDMLINDLESELLKAKRAAFSNTDVVVNKSAILDIVSRIRMSYPQSLKEAALIKKERDEIIEKAENYANETMDKAEEQARMMISEEAVLKRAQADAQELQNQASLRYQKLDYEARVHAFDILNDVESSIKSALVQINDFKQKLVND